MGESPVARRVQDAVAGAVAALGLLVEDVTVTPAGKRRVVRIAVDRDLGDVPPLGDLPEQETPAQSPVPPLDLDAVADATRAISDALDASDALGAAPYTLEVTSPGVSRPLTLPRHFRRNVGRLVRLTLAGGGKADRVTGRIVAAGEDAVWLAVEKPGAKGAKGRPVPTTVRAFPLADVDRGDVQVEFGRADDAPLDDGDLGDDTDLDVTGLDDELASDGDDDSQGTEDEHDDHDHDDRDDHGDDQED